MNGFNFERLMARLLEERGVKLLSAEDLGLENSELLAIAHKDAPVLAKAVDNYLEAKNINPETLTAKAVLDNYFKVDQLIELRLDGKRVVFGLQFFTFHEGHYEGEWKNKAAIKLNQLLQAKVACDELFIQNSYVVIGFVPTSWEGTHFMTQREIDNLNLQLDQLISMIASEQKPTCLTLRF